MTEISELSDSFSPDLELPPSKPTDASSSRRSGARDGQGPALLGNGARGIWETLHEKGHAAKVITVARKDRALEQAETVLRHWNRASGPNVGTRDPFGSERVREIKRAVFTGDSTRPSEWRTRRRS